MRILQKRSKKNVEVVRVRRSSRQHWALSNDSTAHLLLLEFHILRCSSHNEHPGARVNQTEQGDPTNVSKTPPAYARSKLLFCRFTCLPQLCMRSCQPAPDVQIKNLRAEKKTQSAVITLYMYCNLNVGLGRLLNPVSRDCEY